MSEEKSLAVKEPVVIDRRPNYDEKDAMTDALLPKMERAVILRHPQATEVMNILREINGRTLGAKVLILPLPPDDHYGLLYLPEKFRGEQDVGIVVGVGRGSLVNGQLIAPEVQPGNYVQFTKYVHNRIKVGEYELFQVHEQEISFAVGGATSPETANG